MLILTFEDFNNEFGTNDEPMSKIRIKDIGKDISLTPIEIVIRDQTPNTIHQAGSPIMDTSFNIILNLDSTVGTHWVLVIRREGGPI